jgi:hypothetical protein
MSEKRQGITRWSWMGAKSRKKLQVLLVCLVLSSFIWLTRELSKDASTAIQVQIELVDLQDSLVVVSANVTSLEVSLNSSGFELFGKHLKQLEPLQLRLKQVLHSGQVEYSEAQLKSLLQQHVGGEATVISFVPDELVIEVDKKVTRTVNVFPVLEVKTAKNCFVSGLPVVTPLAVNVTGARSILDTMQFVYTNPVRTKILESDHQAEVSLNLPSNVGSDQHDVTVDINVDQWTEKTLTIPISKPPLEDGLTMRTYPDSVAVTFQVGLKDFNTITPAQFKADVVLKDASELQKAYKLPLHLSNQPSSIRNITFSPPEVEFILIKG